MATDGSGNVYVADFDRLMFKGHLPLGYPHAMEVFLTLRGVLFKDLKARRVRAEVAEERTLLLRREPRHAAASELVSHTRHLELPHLDRHGARRVEPVAAPAPLAQHPRPGRVGIGERRAARGGEEEKPEETPQNASRQYADCPGASATPISSATSPRPPASARSASRMRLTR